MGAGAGAAAAIDNNEPSPRGSAIEKAQAELRFRVGCFHVFNLVGS